jgi:hypothetical protein
MVAQQRADAKLPGDGIATPREIGERPGVTARDTPCRAIASRAAGFSLCRSEQQGDLGARVVEVPGVQVQRCGCGYYMGNQVLNCPGSSGVHFSLSSSLD